MLDLGHLPEGQRANVQLFKRPCTVTATQYETWVKPRGVSMLYLIAIGGGSGGGGGYSGASTSSRGGGAGGASGGMTRLLIPAMMVPSMLFIQVGAGGVGGAGGAPGAAGASGVTSQILIYPSIDQAQNILMKSDNAVATGGAFGSTSGNAVAGVAGTIPISSAQTANHCGIYQFVAGSAGSTGGAPNGAGTAVTLTGNGSTNGGSGGGGVTSTDRAGGDVTNNTGMKWVEWAPKAAAAGSVGGSGGTTLWEPFYSYGGMGGGASDAGVGGDGGNGGHGSGGGGGGGGTTGGKGGDGGSGLVMIFAW